ncbi:hypothetical protein [Olsenella sp. An188]|uniref:hypothetical protein n=1 Tax=Olsenella sp. An188 TaxID=1965579 RepID=UPI000B3AC428|nr:hypothetical protein [Olsenella sp. An188]OUP37546.1 hypothetical protein B5F23_09450 [Olsenella sp. An188]
MPYLLRRLLYFLAWLSLGRAYRKWLERYDVVRGSVYFPVLVALQLLLLYTCNGSVTYQLAWGYYPHGVVQTFLCTATGIAMLPRVCRYVSPFVSRDERGLVRLIGDNTFSIMCHHYMGLFVIDALVFIVSRLTPLFGSFDVAVWRKTTKYVYLPHGIEQFEVFYIVFSIVFSIAVHFGWVRLKMAVGSLVQRAARYLHRFI